MKSLLKIPILTFPNLVDCFSFSINFLDRCETALRTIWKAQNPGIRSLFLSVGAFAATART
jgi:hypothetical protein